MTQKEQIKMTLKSPIYNGGKLVKFLNGDFSSPTLLAKKWTWSNANQQAVMIDYQVDGAFISIQQHTVCNKYSVETNYEGACLNLHFELEGVHCCQWPKKDTALISEGLYNLYYYPNIGVTSTYTAKPRFILDIYFCKQFLRKIIGKDDYLLANFKEALSLKKQSTLWMRCQSISNDLKMLMLQITKCDLPDSLKKSFLEAKVVELLVLILTKKTNKQSPIIAVDDAHHDYNAIKKVERYIQMNLKNKLTIPQLAQLAGCNTSKLKKEFKQEFNTTIFKHITQLRMQAAKELILKKNYTISQASYEVGYKNAQHFTVAFKKTFGFLPRELKK